MDGDVNGLVPDVRSVSPRGGRHLRAQADAAEAGAADEGPLCIGKRMIKLDSVPDGRPIEG